MTDLTDEVCPLLGPFGQLGVELLDLGEPLGEGQRLLRPLGVLDGHLQSRKARVPHIQLVPHTLNTDTPSVGTVLLLGSSEEIQLVTDIQLW